MILGRASATVAADGTATVILNGPSPGYVWTVNLTSVLLSAGRGEATVHRGFGTVTEPVDSTYGAERNQSDTIHHLYPGDALTVAFSGCTPGVTASVAWHGVEEGW